MAAYALRADDVGLAGCVVKGDGLVAAVQARGVAAPAADAALAVNLRIDNGGAV